MGETVMLRGLYTVRKVDWRFHGSEKLVDMRILWCHKAMVTSGPMLPPGHVLILGTIAAGDCVDV